MDCSQCNDTFDMDDQWAFRGDTWPACNFHCVSLHTGASTKGHDVRESSREFGTHIRGPERGRLGGGSDAVKAFMEERFGPAVLNDASVA